MTAADARDEDELLRWMRVPASLRLRRAGWTLTTLAAVANLANAYNVVGVVGKVQNSMGALWLFGTHAALALALCSLLVPRARRLTLTRRAALLGVVFASLSLVAFLVSCAAVYLLSHGPFTRLF